MQSFGKVRNLIIHTSEFIDARLRLQQSRRSLVHLQNGRPPPEIRALIDLGYDEARYEFALFLKDEYAMMIEQAREDLVDAKRRARQVLRETVIEGCEEGMALQLYDVFCGAVERRAKPQRRDRRKISRE